MVQVPIVERAQDTRPIPAAQITPFYRAPDSSGTNNLVDAVNKLAYEAKDRADTTSLLQAQQAMDQWEAKNIYDPNTGALAKRGKDAFNVPNVLAGQFDGDMQQIYDGLSNNEQRTAFQKMAVSRRDTMMKMLYTHERQQMDSFAVDTAKSATDSSLNRAALNYNNPQVVRYAIDAAKGAQVALGKAQGLPDEMIQNNMQQVESKVHLAVMSRLADNDPKAAIDYFNANQGGFTGEDLLAANRVIVPTERKYKAMDVAKNVMDQASPRVDQDGIISYVMNTLEGGDKVVTDSNGSIAKYGINKAWNQDTDVANLTEEGARQLYLQRWNRLGIDKLPADMRLPAMAFGTTNEKELPRLVEESGGDPRKFQQLAAGFYQDLATKDPERYGSSLQGWMNRIANVSAQVDVMHGQLPNEFEINNRIDAMTNDIQVAQDAKEMVNKQYEAIKRAQNDSYAAASQEAWRYRQNGMEVPPSVVSRMKPSDAADMQKNAPADPALYEQVRQKVLAGIHVNLGDMRWRLGSKYDDLVSLQGDPTKMVNARKVDDVIDSAGQVLLGKSRPKSESDFKKIEQFRRSVQIEIDALQKSTGKAATGDDVQKITDRLLLKTSGADGDRLYELLPGEQAKVGGIPSQGTHLIGGKVVTQEEVLDKIIQKLNESYIPVTDDSVKTAYKRLLSTGQVQFTYDKVGQDGR